MTEATDIREPESVVTAEAKGSSLHSLVLQPFYEDSQITLYNADCRQVLPHLQVDNAFCFTDPPYNVGKDYGVWNDEMPEADYLQFCREWIAEVKRLCPEICIYPPTKYLLEYWTMLGREYKQVALTWSPEGAIRGGWVNQFVTLLTNAKPKQRTKDWWHNCQMQGLGYFFREESYGHPGYTSEDVTNRVLAAMCPTGATVIEPFAGTGTTLWCAKLRGMKAIGCEVNPDYCKLIADRCSQGVLGLENAESSHHAGSR